MRARVLALAGLLATCQAVDGFLIQTFEGTGGPVQQHWSTDEVRYYLHEAGSDDMTAEETFAVLRASFAVWEQVPTSRLRFVDRGVTGALVPSRGDGFNLVAFDETGDWLDAPPETGIIAITRINSSSRTGRILDADIIFNGRDYRFGSGQSGRVELVDVAVHEIGHLLGLDHTPLDGAAAVRPTMNPYYRGDGRGEAASLEADDVAGISSLYPAEDFAAQTGTLTGRVIDIEEQPVFGAHVLARSIDGRTAIGTITGAYPWLGDAGFYQLGGLPPGTYRLQLSAIEGDIDEDNFSGIFADFTTGFPFEYYDNVSRLDLARQIDVASGELTSGLDFTTGLVLADLPYFEPLVTPTNTPDPEGPYDLSMRVLRAEEATLRVDYGDGAALAIPMAEVAADTFVAQIPGHAPRERIAYQVEAVSADGYRAVFPAVGQWASFEVVRLSGAALAFAALRDEDVVAVIDLGTQREVARVPAGDEPIQIAATPDGRRVYVSSLASGEITVIDGTTLQMIGRIATAAEPLDLTLAVDGRTAYVANSGGFSITAIDVISNRASTIPVPGLGGGPYGIAAAADGGLFVTDLAENQVVALAADGRVAARIPVAAQPRSLALSPDGERLYVTSFASGALTVVDTRQLQVAATVDLPVAGTFAVAVTADGARTYVTSHTDDVVLAVDTRADTVIDAIPAGPNPRSLAFTPSGDTLVVSAAGAGQIRLVRVADHRELAVLTTGLGPRGVTVLPAPAAPGPGSETAVSIAPLPVAFALEPVYPNPFNAAANVVFSLEAAAGEALPVAVTVHNLLGQPVRTLMQQMLVAGRYQATWDGRNDAGQALASGPYFIRLRAPGGAAVRKAVLLR